MVTTQINDPVYLVIVLFLLSSRAGFFKRSPLVEDKEHAHSPDPNGCVPRQAPSGVCVCTCFHVQAQVVGVGAEGPVELHLDLEGLPSADDQLVSRIHLGVVLGSVPARLRAQQVHRTHRQLHLCDGKCRHEALERLFGSYTVNGDGQKDKSFSSIFARVSSKALCVDSSKFCCVPQLVCYLPFPLVLHSRASASEEALGGPEGSEV